MVFRKKIKPKKKFKDQRILQGKQFEKDKEYDGLTDIFALTLV